MPDTRDLAAGNARVDDIREVDITDLLGRDPVPPNPKLLDACIRGKSVMVTGAGGSIGSELCRQIVQLAPKRLVLLDISEAALYTIDQSLQDLAQRHGSEVEIVALIGSAHHRERVREVLETYTVHTVYHAAAYKHVPLVEHNMIEGVHNNVFGTLHTAEAAIAAGVKSFVLVSTDKAVLPTNVMGATKRLPNSCCKGSISEARRRRSRSCVSAMCLASSGSVVPLFREQIRNGGPVTVTHPEIYPLLHDHTGGRLTGFAGGLDGHRRRRVRARHGQAGADSRSRRKDDPPHGAHGARRVSIPTATSRFGIRAYALPRSCTRSF